MSFFSKQKPVSNTSNSLLNGLRKTRAILTSNLSDLFTGRKQIDAELLEELETRLLMADMGIETTDTVLDALRKHIGFGDIDSPLSLLTALRDLLRQRLQNPEPLSLVKKPHAILVVGVNGSGKTTTIGKLARHYQQLGHSVLLAAGDTFRAAAVEQLQTWGARNKVPVVAQGNGADSAAVIFDALQSAQARGIEILLADTAGRLHTQSNLMEELKKVKRVLTKLDPQAPQETWLVLDATTGQNALQQARQFHQAIGLTGLVITKLDGTAKGGIIFAIKEELNLPVCYIGVGEGIDDLKPFNADDFVDALLASDE
ncbi:MAG: signal recognition particle-docking protein FtsY [Gammaproteobacteria bacterium]|nr:signal recognition particle-docking protein FtsY [Gammaproteobacteria bacterium]